MSCPDWGALVAQRDGSDEPAGWSAALAHLDDCEECRRRSRAADPSLIFRDVATAALSGEEQEELRRGVATLRRAQGLDVGERSALPWSRFAAAAFLALLVPLGARTPLPPDGPGASVPLVAVSPPAAPASLVLDPPVIEDFDEPGARVYQMRQEDLSVVMIVDEHLDV